MSVFANYLLYFVPSTYIGVLLLSFTQIFFIHRKPDIFLSSLPLTMIVTTAVIIAVAIVVYANVKDCDAAFNAMTKEKRNAKLKEKITILKTTRKLNKISVIAIIIGFIIGTMVSCVLKMRKEILEYKLSRVIVVLVESIIYGYFESMFMYNAVNEMFTKYRKRLHINTLAKEQKTLSISTAYSMLAVATILFVGMNFFVLGFGVIDENLGEAVKDFNLSALYVGVPVFVVTMFMFVFVFKGLKTRISSATEVITALETGSLAHRIDISVFDDFGVLNSEINNLIKKLTDMLAALRSEAQNVNNSANQLAQISDSADITLSSMKESLYRIGNESEKQANEISGAETHVAELISSIKQVEDRIVGSAEAMKESTASISSMTDNINSVADMTKRANELSEVLNNLIDNGDKTLKETAATIESINEASNQVKEIVKMLQKVASQTNLLSMNASIEAAHAGAAGQGFAVVAEEVRELAISSSQSSQQIQDYIKDMVDKVGDSVRAIEVTGDSFRQIEEVIKQHAALVESIASAMQEQQAAANENLNSTNAVYNDTNNVRDLVVSQNNLTLGVEDTMTNAVVSTKKMIAAVDKSNESSATMQQVINQINAMIRANKEAVERMNEQMNAFSL